jgi:hypothetical protein
MILHRAPPPVETTEFPAMPTPVEVQPGGIGWPQVFLYEFTVEGATYRSPLPPPRMPLEAYEIACRADLLGLMSKRPGAAPTWPYRIVVRPGQLAVYDAMTRAGMLRDPAHTGSAPQDMEAPALPVLPC